MGLKRRSLPIDKRIGRRRNARDAMWNEAQITGDAFDTTLDA